MKNKRFQVDGRWIYDAEYSDVFNIDFMYSFRYDKLMQRTYVFFKDGRKESYSDCSITKQRLYDVLVNVVI